ncbi:HtaA domain-containing protein [Paenarthrobacter nitroguajacolicus]|uniref:HtaA domain-containing protein n=1 Tax=Paenarthrobacter nitroguajacolicus TaxID=211146 RepID=UPI00248A9A54|nr:HtaA domain-containing protein [Paenarthrobacter nitroguajacolicus]MDI2035896.1 hypothetical protein [Paenarthrobacter nitroguajacolicus]
MNNQAQQSVWDVSSSYVEWGIKRSLREYVLGTEDGTIEWVAPASERRFPAHEIINRAAVDELCGVFEGSVRFRAHGSLMDVAVGSISVEIGSMGAAISIAGISSGTFAEHEGSVRRIQVNGVIEILIEHPALTSRGAAFLGGVYTRGTLLDPLRLVLALEPHPHPARAIAPEPGQRSLTWKTKEKP